MRINRRKKYIAKSLIVGLSAFMMASGCSFASSGKINNIMVEYGDGEVAASTLTKNINRRDGLVDLTDDKNSRWITARMRKGQRESRGYVSGVVTLREGTMQSFTNDGLANTNYTLYIARTYKGDNSVSYVNGVWKADK